MNLKYLQQMFQEYLFNNKHEIESLVSGNETVIPKERLAVYYDAYRLRIIEILKDTYSALYYILGDDEFDCLAESYLKKYPSSTHSLRWYGDQLSQFLKEDEGYSSYPFLSELAQFEWQLAAAFDAQDADRLSVNDMCTIAPSEWANLTFRFHPSVSRLNLKWNVVEMWQEANKEASVSEPKELELTGWVIWRSHDRKNHFQSLTVDQACALDALMQGESFGSVCELLCEWIDEEYMAARVAGLLKGWVQAGMVIRAHSLALGY